MLGDNGNNITNNQFRNRLRLKSAIQVEFVSLTYVEVPLEGFRGPPTDVVFEDAMNERFVLRHWSLPWNSICEEP
jgi:hypothetical protein